MKEEKSIGITGHRDLSHHPDKIISVMQKSLKLLQKRGYSKVVNGMAIGYDLLVAEACINIGMPFVAAFPFHTHGSNWPDRSRKKLQEILRSAKEITYVCDGYCENWKYLKRDRYIVDNSDIIVSYWDGRESGGTFYTKNYAMQNKVPVVNIFEVIDG